MFGDQAQVWAVSEGSHRGSSSISSRKYEDGDKLMDDMMLNGELMAAPHTAAQCEAVWITVGGDSFTITQMASLQASESRPSQ